MPRVQGSLACAPDTHVVPIAGPPAPAGRTLICDRCCRRLECVEQNRRLGTWVGSFICPNCRNEYFYAYRWGRLLLRA